MFSIFKLSSIVPENLIGPSAIGLKNKFLLSLKIAIVPVKLQTAIKYSSPRVNIDSCKKLDAPCAIIQSRSISPTRKPPSLARPCTVCLVKTVLGPRAR